MIKKSLIKLVERIHLLLFGSQMSEQMRDFISNVSWLFLAGLIVMPISLLIGTLAGRLMGPSQFGEYNLVVLISSYLMIVIFFGLDISTIKSFVKASTFAQKRKTFSSSFVFVAIMLLLLVILELVFGRSVADYFNLPHELIVFAVIYTVLASLKMIMDIACRAQEKFKIQAIGKVVEIIVVAVAFVVLAFILRNVNFTLYIISLGAGMVVLAAYYLPTTWKYFGSFSLGTLRTELTEGRFFMLSALLGNIFISSDRLLIAKIIGLEALGVYSAYYMASITIVAVASQVFVSVLLPASAKLRDKSFSLKLDQLFKKGFIPIFIACSILIVIFLKIFGRAYPLRLDYTLLFSLVSSLYFFQILYQTIIFDASRKRYLQYFLLSNVVNLLTVLAYFIFLRFISQSIDFILVGFSVNLIIVLVIQRYFVRQMRNEELPVELTSEKI